MNKQQKIIVSIVGITIVLLALLGITYAYYLTRIQGNTNTNSISVTTANLKLKYEDGNGLLTATNITPGKQVEFKTTGNETTTEKTFTVTNTGNSTIEGYAVSLDYAYIENVMPSIFERPEDFQITLTCTTNKTGESCNGFTGNFNNESIMMTSNHIDEGEVHTYSLSIYYNDPSLDQSNDMGKNLNLKVQIYNINETTDIEGTITGVDSKYSVKIESEPKMSTIINGKYNFKGIEIGTHTLTILDKDGNEVDKEYIVVKNGTTPGINATKATIDDTEVDATEITITNEQRLVKLNTKVESNTLSFDTNTSSTEIFNPYSNNKNSLAYNIINNINNGTLEGKTTFVANLNSLNMADNITTAEDKLLSTARDDYGTSYYFRGNPIDNYIEFANMCWRIVRIQGDGSIKLILSSELSCSEENLTNDSGFATDGTAGVKGNILTGHYGYKILNELKVNAYLNSPEENSTSARTQLNNWFSRKITTENENKLKKDSWCIGDLTNAYSNEDTGEIIGMVDEMLSNGIEFEYSSGNKYFVTKTPSYICDSTGKEGEKDLNKVGMLTFDEIVYAGGGIEINSNYYINNNSKTNYFALLSLAGLVGTEEFVFTVNSSGRFGYGKVNNTTYAFRPVITLKSNIIYSNGNGTISNPYVVE